MSSDRQTSSTWPDFRLGFDGSRRPRPHHAGDLEDIFVAYALRLGEHVRGVRIEYDLQQPLAVAQVDENDSSVVAAAMSPAGDRDGLANRRFADLAAIMSAHTFNQLWEARDATA